MSEQNYCNFADIFKCISSINVYQILLMYAHKGLIENESALDQVMASQQTGYKPLHEPMMTNIHN